MASGGRPLIYSSSEEMQEVIDRYFKQCEGEPLRDGNREPMLNKYGNPIIINSRPPTITGLALALGLASRQALLNYQEREAFNDAVTRAKARVEQYAEERLFDRDGTNGAQFSLKNNFRGWDADKRDEPISGGVTIVNNIPRPESSKPD